MDEIVELLDVDGKTVRVTLTAFLKAAGARLEEGESCYVEQNRKLMVELRLVPHSLVP